MYFSLQTNPLLIRVDTKAGHGFGKPTAKIVSLISLHRVPNKFFGCRNLHYLKASIQDLKERWGRVCTGCGMTKRVIGITELREHLGRDNGIGEPYWGLSMLVLALKDTYQLRGVAITLRMRTTISPRQWHVQLLRPYWGSSAWHNLRICERANPCIKDPLLPRRVQKSTPLRGARTGEPVYQRPITAEASTKKYSFKRQLHCGKVVANGWEPHAKQFSHGMRMEIYQKN